MFPSVKWVGGESGTVPVGSCFASLEHTSGPQEEPGGQVPSESSSFCLHRAQKLLAEVSRERGELQGERGELRSRLARLELERAQLEMQSQRLRESNQQLDLSACRLTTQCEVWGGAGGGRSGVGGRWRAGMGRHGE